MTRARPPSPLPYPRGAPQRRWFSLCTRDPRKRAPLGPVAWCGPPSCAKSPPESSWLAHNGRCRDACAPALSPPLPAWGTAEALVLPVYARSAQTSTTRSCGMVWSPILRNISPGVIVVGPQRPLARRARAPPPLPCRPRGAPQSCWFSLCTRDPRKRAPLGPVAWCGPPSCAISSP